MIGRDIRGAEIALCAALGSAMAGTVLGIWAAIALSAPSADIGEAIPAMVMLVLFVTVLATLVGTPMGIGIGCMIAHFVGTSPGHAALTGSLTGIAYPLVMLVAGILMHAEGLAGLIESFALFGVVGAACGASAYWLVIGRKRRLQTPHRA